MLILLTNCSHCELLLILLIALTRSAFGVYIIISRNKIKDKNQALTQIIDEMNDTKKRPLANPDNDTSEEYQRMLITVYDEELYSQPQLDRDSFASHMHISRKELNAILSSNTNGLTFPQWINGIRLERACDLLQNDPGMTVAEIAAAVGLTPDHLRRIFRQQYGISPIEYRERGYS